MEYRTRVATYSYDTFGAPTSVWEAFTNGWHNPYLYDGRHDTRYDSETGLYWMSVRAYDPSLGRFISHDPLGRAPLLWAMQPYAYGGNNPVSNVDPSGQFSRATADGGYRGTDETAAQEAAFEARVYTVQGSSPVGTTGGCED